MRYSGVIWNCKRGGEKKKKWGGKKRKQGGRTTVMIKESNMNDCFIITGREKEKEAANASCMAER